MSEMRCLFVAVLALVLRARMPDRRSTGGSLPSAVSRVGQSAGTAQLRPWTDGLGADFKSHFIYLVRVTVEVNYYENRKWD